MNPLAHLSEYLRLSRWMARERFDIVHVHTPIAGLIGRLAAERRHVPITFYTAHGDIFALVCAVLAMCGVGWSARKLLRQWIGIWKNRVDMEDSESFIRNLRDDDRQERLKAD